jgi:hypothetical protein
MHYENTTPVPRTQSSESPPAVTVTGPTLASSRDWGTLGFAMWSGGQEGHAGIWRRCALSFCCTRNEDPTKRALPVVSNIKRVLVSPVVSPSFPSHITPLHLST